MPVKPATPSAVLQVGTTEVRLWELPFSIGRSSKNTLTIRDRHLSRSHCEIDQTSDGFAIRNLSDLNPTLVNDKEIQTRLLVDGDEIRVHDHKFIFRLDREDLDEPVKGDTVIRTSPGRVQTTGPEDQTAGAPPQTTGPEDQATAPEASSDAESAASPRPKASGVAAGAVPAPTPQSKDQPLAPVVIAGLLFFGLFGMAGLMLHQNGQSNQMTAQVIQELSGMQQEFGALHKEIQTAREVYLEESKRNNEAWKKLLATRSQSPRVVSQPRQHTPRPTPQKAPTPPTKKKPIQASEKPPAPTKTPPSPANKPPTTASKKNPTPAPATPKGGSQDVTRSTSPKQQPQPAKQQANQPTGPTDKPASQPGIRPTNQPTSQPGNQSTNQPTSHPTSRICRPIN